MSDGELVRLTLAGRTAAYEELVRRWAPRVLALCHARVGDGTAAEDLAQETLLRGFRGLSTLVEPAKFGSWLCGIAVRTCLDWLKSKQRSQKRFADLGDDGQADGFVDGRASAGPASVERRDELSRLMSEVESLPLEYREVLMLFYYEDLSYRDIAALLGVSPATVNARLTKARTMLRERLGVARS